MYLHYHNAGINDESIYAFIADGRFAKAIANANLSPNKSLEINLSANSITTNAAIALIRHLLDINRENVNISLDLSNNDITENPILWELLCKTCALLSTEYIKTDKMLEDQIYKMISAKPLGINILENPISCFRLHELSKFRIS